MSEKEVQGAQINDQEMAAQPEEKKAIVSENPTTEAVSADTNSQDSIATEPQESKEAVETASNKDSVDNSTVSDEVTETENEKEKTHPFFETKTEVVEAIKELAKKDEIADRGYVDFLKQCYFKLHNKEIMEQRQAFIDKGNDANDFVPPADTEEETFKSFLKLVREKRHQVNQALEEEKQTNLNRKKEIIERIKELSASPDKANENFNEFRKLQEEWKEIKQIPNNMVTEIWKTYHLYVEQFYDQLHLNHEFRMLDFKKNLEAKTRLCEAAEKLIEVEDIISAFNQLQKLHQEYRETGPVAREFRDEIWQRFKTASTKINKRHQEHFEKLKLQQEENLKKKTELCEKMEAIDLEELNTYDKWEKMTQQVFAWQAEWKTIGFTPKKMNTPIFDRFRAACDTFFHKKASHFKEVRETYSNNLQLKRELCEKAEELKDSTEWNKVTSQMTELQKKWRTIGPVARKHSDEIWTRFNTACNMFFENRNKANAGQRETEHANLEKKRAIIADLKKILEEKGDDVQDRLSQLSEDFRNAGHVPFKYKDKVYKEYKEVLDRIYDELNISRMNRNFKNFKRQVAEKGGNELSRQRNSLYHAYEAKKNEIKTFETNMLFLTSNSKKGNTLVDEMYKKVDLLKKELEMLEQKVQTIDKKIKEDENKEEN